MLRPAPSDVARRATPLRPATYAGVAAATLSIVAAVVIRLAPSSETVVAGLHLVATFAVYAAGGALAAVLGGAGWRAGLFAGMLDALVGHAIAFFIAPPPDAARYPLPDGTLRTPAALAAMHLWGAVLGAAIAIAIATGAGALGGWYARSRGMARTPPTPGG